MPYDGSTWDETNPTNNTPANEIDDIALDIKKGVSGRLNKEHTWPASQASTASGGTHTYITFANQTAAPILPVVLGTTQCAGIYFITNNGYIIDSAGSSRLLYQSGVGLALTATSTQGYVPFGTSGGGMVPLAPTVTGYVLVSSGPGANPTFSAAAPRAWLSMSGSNAAVVLSSYNINTLSRDAEGTYSISLVTTMTSTNYAITVSPMYHNGQSINHKKGYGQVIDSGNLKVYFTNVSDAATDAQYACITIYGT